MKAVLLAGGLGTRISEETTVKPKPMIEIGYKPILWHIMKSYSTYGVNEFIICAETVSSLIPDTEISINKKAPPDKRSYRVDFSLFSQLAPEYIPITNLAQFAKEVRDGLQHMQFNDANFRESQLIPLKVLEKLMATNKMNNNLEWVF